MIFVEKQILYWLEFILQYKILSTRFQGGAWERDLYQRHCEQNDKLHQGKLIRADIWWNEHQVHKSAGESLLCLCPSAATAIQERNIYNESQLYDWCKDGDLSSFVTGEFDVFTSSGERGRGIRVGPQCLISLWPGNLSLSQPLNIVLLAGKSSLELMVLIRNVACCCSCRS